MHIRSLPLSFSALGACALLLTGCLSSNPDGGSSASSSSGRSSSMSAMAQAKPVWTENGTSCFVGLEREERERMHTELLALNPATKNTHFNTYCSLPDGSRWFSGNFSKNNHPTEAYLRLIGSGGTILKDLPGHATSGGDFSPCDIAAVRGDDMILRCRNGDAGWGFQEFRLLDTVTGKSETLYANESWFQIDACINTPHEGECVPKDTDFTTTLPGCTEVTREGAPALRKLLSAETLGVECLLPDGRKIVTYLAPPSSKQGKVGDAGGNDRATAVALLSATGGILSGDVSFSSMRVSDTFLTPPRYVRISEDRRFFLSHSESGNEKHTHLFLVDTTANIVKFAMSNDTYSDPVLCKEWDICNPDTF